MHAAYTPWLVVLLTAAMFVLALVLRRWVRARAARRRMARARRGERSARALLIGHGFSVDEEQAPGRLVLSVDGAPSIHAVRADYLVSRGSSRYVAEVKTGERAPTLEHAPTRRQLLEYRAAFDVDVVLLVDPEAGTVREVTLPGARGSRLTLWFALGVGLGVALGVLGVLVTAP